MKNWPFWVLGAVLLFVLLKSKGYTGTVAGTQAGGTLPNTGTASQAPAPWLSNVSLWAQSVFGTANQVGTEVNSGSKGLFNIFGLFGGSSTATGSQSPATSGSGTGVVNNSQAGDNTGSGSLMSSDAESLLPMTAGWDQFGGSDFGGSSLGNNA